MAFSIDGIASGLDTTTMINQLMQLEARPQTLIKNKVSATQILISGLQQLNTRLASLGELAEKTAKPDALSLHTATTNSDDVTATASSSARAGSLDFTVDRLAQRQVSVTAAMTAWPDDPATLTITTSDGTATEVSPASASLDDIVTAINDSESGVTALKVTAGTDPTTGEELFRLQLSAAESGVDGAFTIHRGTVADVTAGTATDLLADPGAANVRTAQDAQVTLWAGTAAAQAVTSSSNTFSALLPGVDVTAKAVSTEPVTVTVARDAAASQRVARDLVSGLTGVLSFISANSTVTPSAPGENAAVGGVFTSDSAVRDVERRILDAATGPVDGRSPSEIGISITRDGSVEFDAEKFDQAMAEDPARVAHVLQTVAGRVAETATGQSDKFDGSLTLRIQSQERSVGNLNDEILDWDRRLETRRATLERTWSSLEVQLQSLQSQGEWLSSQLGNLPTIGGNDK